MLNFLLKVTELNAIKTNLIYQGFKDFSLELASTPHPNIHRWKVSLGYYPPHSFAKQGDNTSVCLSVISCLNLLTWDLDICLVG